MAFEKIKVANPIVEMDGKGGPPEMLLLSQPSVPVAVLSSRRSSSRSFVSSYPRRDSESSGCYDCPAVVVYQRH